MRRNGQTVAEERPQFSVLVHLGHGVTMKVWGSVELRIFTKQERIEDEKLKDNFLLSLSKQESGFVGAKERSLNI